MKEKEIIRQLASVINRNNLEIVSQTPDWIIAEFLIDALKALDTAIIKRDKWFSMTSRD